MKCDRINLLRWHERLSDWANETPKRKKLLEWSFPIWLLIVVPWGTFMVSPQVLQHSEAAREIVSWGVAIFPYLGSMREWGEVGEKPLFLFCVFHFTAWIPAMLGSFSIQLEKKCRERATGIFLLGVIGLSSLAWCIANIGHEASLHNLAEGVAGKYSAAFTTAWVSYGAGFSIFVLFVSLSVLIEELHALIQKIKKIMEGM
jgi:hypothetical protein